MDVKQTKYTKIDSEYFTKGKFIKDYFLVIGIKDENSTVNLLIIDDSKKEITYRQAIKDTPENRETINNIFSNINSIEKIEKLIQAQKLIRKD